MGLCQSRRRESGSLLTVRRSQNAWLCATTIVIVTEAPCAGRSRQAFPFYGRKNNLLCDKDHEDGPEARYSVRPPPDACGQSKCRNRLRNLEGYEAELHEGGYGPSSPESALLSPWWDRLDGSQRRRLGQLLVMNDVSPLTHLLVDGFGSLTRQACRGKKLSCIGSRHRRSSP